MAPIFVPATPRSELLKRMRKAAEETEKEGIKFTLVEMGGRTLKSELQRSNPTATPGCNLADCHCCKGEEGKGANATETMLIIRSYASFAQKGEKWCTLEKLPRISIPE